MQDTWKMPLCAAPQVAVPVVIEDGCKFAHPNEWLPMPESQCLW